MPDCLNGGTCNNGTCECALGYSGPACRIGKSFIIAPFCFILIFRSFRVPGIIRKVPFAIRVCKVKENLNINYHYSAILNLWMYYSWKTNSLIKELRISMFLAMKVELP